MLDFSFGNRGFEESWKVGEYFEGGLVFYPSVFPQRAILKAKEGIPTQEPVLNGFLTVEKFKAHLSDAFSKNPWMTNFPVRLHLAIFSANPFYG